MDHRPAILKDDGTIGGGSGGAIYNDGTMTLKILGTLIEKNKVNAYGSAVFFVTNDHTGDIRIDNSVIRNNTGGSLCIRGSQCIVILNV
jgi:hypothetical protein